MAILFTGAGVGDIGVEVEDPQGMNSVELLVEDRGNQVYRCVYKPVQPGPHVIKVTFAGDAIPKSPFGVQIGEGKSWPTIPGMETDRPGLPPSSFCQDSFSRKWYFVFRILVLTQVVFLCFPPCVKTSEMITLIDDEIIWLTAMITWPGFSWACGDAVYLQ